MHFLGVSSLDLGRGFRHGLFFKNRRREQRFRIDVIEALAVTIGREFHGCPVRTDQRFESVARSSWIDAINPLS